jgi:pimeloyl-ACP methyl ester carboxylesterase
MPLHYHSLHPEQTQTIVFLHAAGVAGWMWQPVVDLLPDFHCLLPDLPAQGRSAKVGPFSMQLATDDVIALIRERAYGGKAIVVGLSEGAQAAVQMLATAPQVIERALISSALLLPLPGMRWMGSPGLLRWMYRISVPPFRNNAWWMRLNMKYAAAVPDEYFPHYREEFQRMTESRFVDLMLANQRFRLPENLGDVPTPTLAVAGVREYKAMKESARLLADALPNGRAVLVDLGRDSSLGVEHNWAMNAPALFAGTLRKFIQGEALPGVVRAR